MKKVYILISIICITVVWGKIAYAADGVFVGFSVKAEQLDRSKTVNIFSAPDGNSPNFAYENIRIFISNDDYVTIKGVTHFGKLHTYESGTNFGPWLNLDFMDQNGNSILENMRTERTGRACNEGLPDFRVPFSQTLMVKNSFKSVKSIQLTSGDGKWWFCP